MSLVKKGNNYVYGVNNTLRALDSVGSLTNTFKNDLGERKY